MPWMLFRKLAFVIVSLLAIGCGLPPEEPGQGPEPVSITIAVSSDWAGINELKGGSKLSRDIQALLFPQLARERGDHHNHPPTFAPNLADSWEFSSDLRTLTFHLDPDRMWNDGIPVTADDVYWTWQAQTSAQVAWPDSYLKENIETVEVLDAQTVRFTFTSPSRSQFFEVNEGFILPKHRWSQLPFEKWKDESDFFLENLATAGPFRFEKWTPQGEIVLNRNEAGPKGSVDRVVFRIIPHQATQVAELLAGSVDMIRSAPIAFADRIEASPDHQILPYDAAQYNFLVWNIQNPLFHKVAVRRALTLAIDRERLVKSIYGNRALVGISPIPRNMWAFDPSLEPWPFDPQEARRLLDQEGWSDHDGDGFLDREGQVFEFELITNTGNQLRADACVLIQQDLERVGIRVQLRSLELASMIRALSKQEFDGVLSAWGISTDLDFRYAFHSEEIDGGSNFGSFRNPELDAILDGIQHTTDQDEAKELFQAAQRLIHQEQPYTFLWEPTRMVALSRRWENVVPTAQSVLQNISEWRLREP